MMSLMTQCSSTGLVAHQIVFGVVDGADDRDRTGDLVLTKDALCQLSYIGPPSLSARFASSVGEAGSRPTALACLDEAVSAANVRRRACLDEAVSAANVRRRACLDEAVSAANVWRSLERETGIEPATNSLEGCDSTTELLPPSLTARFARNFGGQARSHR